MKKKIQLFISILVLLWLASPVLAKAKSVVMLYQPKIAINALVAEGVTSKMNNVVAIDIDAADFKEVNFKEDDYSLIFTIGQKATKLAYEKVKKIPVVFALVSAPRFYNFHERDNFTGVSVDVGVSNYLDTLKTILPKGGKIGFIFKSEQSKYLTNEIDFFEANYSFKSIKRQVESDSELGDALKELIEEKKINAFWMLSDPLYNEDIFKKLANTCKHHNVLLITNFESLVTDAGAAFAIAPSYFDSGVQAGEMATEILAGKNPEYIPIQPPEKTGVYINQTSVKELGIKLPKSLLNLEKITKYFDAAQKDIKSGNSKSALKNLKKLLKLDKRHHSAKLLKLKIDSKAKLAKGKKYLAKGKSKKAVPLLIAAAQFYPEAKKELAAIRESLKGEISKMVKTGEKLYRRKSYKSCIEEMNIVIDLDPGNKAAKVLRSKASAKYKAISALQ